MGTPISARPRASAVESIRSEIASEGPISFARFMELALYDEAVGYYEGGPSRMGPRGDFVTASDVGRDFGRCLARQLVELDRAAGPFRPFDYVEFGAGRGLLARDVLDAVHEIDPDLGARLVPTLVDRSAAMRAAAARTVPEARVLESEARDRARRGVVVAVELFDALAVHRVRRRGGRLVEVYVDQDPAGRLVEIEAEPAPEAARLAERYGAAPEEGDEAEVAPAADGLLDRLLDAVDSGIVLIVDYGDRAAELYGPGRSSGTLVAYRGQLANLDYLAHPGAQDLTAHVNFSQLVDRACERGAGVLAFTTQDRFLIANGILEAFAGTGDTTWREVAHVKRRMQALQLVHPTGMGRVFKVLALSRGLPPLALDGLADPFGNSGRGVGRGPR